MTKSEQKILDKVRYCNEQGALAGLYTSPEEFQTPEGSPLPTGRSSAHKDFRFVKRLYEAGKIVWNPHHPKLGAGWTLPEYIVTFDGRICRDPTV